VHFHSERIQNGTRSLLKNLPQFILRRGERTDFVAPPLQIAGGYAQSARLVIAFSALAN